MHFSSIQIIPVNVSIADPYNLLDNITTIAHFCLDYITTLIKDDIMVKIRQQLNIKRKCYSIWYFCQAASLLELM